MPKNKVSEWSTTAASNTDIGGININEGCPPSGINNAIRELMAQVRDFQLGADGDGLTVSTLNATTATIGALTATSATATNATVTNATVTSLTATNFAVSGTVSGLTVTTLRVLGETTGTTATFGNVTATQLNVSGSVTGTTATFGPVVTDTILEKTSAAGVTIDGLLIKDGALPPGSTGPVLDTAKSTTSGSSINFTDIPSWVKRITVIFDRVSFNDTDQLLVQIGDAGGIETSGYVSRSAEGGDNSTSTSGYIVRVNSGSINASGLMTIVNISGNTWISSHAVDRGQSSPSVGGGTKTLSAVLTQVRITTDLGSAFDNGSVNILYE
jgi:hypothetical protein